MAFIYQKDILDIYVRNDEQLNCKESPPHSQQFVIIKKTVKMLKKTLLDRIICLEWNKADFVINKILDSHL